MTRKPRRRATNRLASPPVKRRSRLHLSAPEASTARPAAAGGSVTEGRGATASHPAKTRSMVEWTARAPVDWKARRPKLVAAALALALVVALAAFFNTDAFYLFQIDVNGNHYLTNPEIERATGIMGYNIFFVEPPAVERALSRLPEVRTARVTTGVPNRVSVDVEERVPEMTWLRGAETYWVDADGVPFRARASLPELTAVRDLDQQPVKAGQTLTSEGLAAVQALRTAWREAPRSLEWSAARGLSFSDERGWKIYLGDASEMAGKLAKYRALAAQLAATNARIKFIDLGKGDPYYQ